MLYAQQQSAISKFEYEALNANMIKIGMLTWPDFAVAINARLKVFVPDLLSTEVAFDIDGQHTTSLLSS
ncbi:MAG: hypothetical protein WBP13_09040 [Methylophilaceae bacterium]